MDGSNKHRNFNQETAVGRLCFVSYLSDAFFIDFVVCFLYLCCIVFVHIVLKLCTYVKANHDIFPKPKWVVLLPPAGTAPLRVIFTLGKTECDTLSSGGQVDLFQ